MNDSPADEVERPKQLGRLLGSALGAGPGRATLAAQRVAILDAAEGLRTHRHRFDPRAFALLVPVLLAAVALLFVMLRSPAELSARYGDRPLEQSELAVAEGSGDHAVAFSDGSRLQLEPAARVELTEVSTERARLTLRGGTLHARIQKHTGRTWSVHAGPYEVRVVGTQFSVSWRAQALSVTVAEGKVLVFGSGLPAAGHALVAGDRLERREVPAPADQRLPPTPEENAPAREPRAAASASASSAPAKETWVALAGKAKYKEALALARQQDFEHLLETLNDNDLLLLSNVARYAGDAARAKAALRKLRARFPGSRAAGLSALYLARVAETQDHDLSEASRWLRQFLKEAPAEDLASGARASLIDMALKLGDRAQARVAAAEYLRFHPSGPHASQARALVDAPP